MKHLVTYRSGICANGSKTFTTTSLMDDFHDWWLNRKWREEGQEWCIILNVYEWKEDDDRS